MRTIPPNLEERLQGPATTLAHAWRLTRADGLVLGFTDHDAPLLFDGTLFAAATGLVAGEAERALGLAAETQSVDGMLASDAVTDADIEAGLYDGARVETFVVDWREPAAHLHLATSVIGEIRRSGAAFTAELRGCEALLDRERGRLYERRCDAAFGDARCGLDLKDAGRQATAVVVTGVGASLTLAGLGADDAAAFRGGLVEAVEDGFGEARETVELVVEGSGVRLRLDAPFRRELTPGTALRLTIGCDKRFATCRDRHRNAANFRGFPHLPGLDTALQVGKADQPHDGRPVVA